MKSIPVWHVGLSVRNPDLDVQHITILETCRDLVASAATQPRCPERVLALLQDVAALVRHHHAFEEGVLESHGCPTLAEVVDHHKSVQAMLDSLVRDADHQSTDFECLSHSITEWAWSHLHERDMPLKAYLKWHHQIAVAN